MSPSMSKRTIRILDEGEWRRRQDLSLQVAIFTCMILMISFLDCISFVVHSASCKIYTIYNTSRDLAS